MQTKRCANCHKLSRAEAVTCSRCGQSFAGNTTRVSTRSALPAPSGKRSAVVERSALRTRRRTIPPASPHRVGHYSGLHPEDQPYQSMIMAAQPVLEHVRAAKPDSLAQSKRMLSVVEDVDSPLEDEQDSLVVVPLRSPFPVRAYAPERKELRKPDRFVSVALTISFLFFLIASSLLTYIFMHRKPLAEKQVLSVVPNQLRVNDTFILSGSGFGPNDLISFTHDKHNEPMLDSNGKSLQTHADDRGTFSV